MQTLVTNRLRGQADMGDKQACRQLDMSEKQTWVTSRLG